MEPKVEEVFRCSECDESFASQTSAAYHCVALPPKEYKCLECGFVWPDVSEAISCFNDERAARDAGDNNRELEVSGV